MTTSLFESFKANGQGHLFAELGVVETDDTSDDAVLSRIGTSLFSQLSQWLRFDDGCGSANGLAALQNIWAKAKQYDDSLSSSSSSTTTPSSAAAMTPIDEQFIAYQDEASQADRDRWTTAGKQAVREGSVAALVLAGGQGTRLGFDKPKGLFDVGLPSGKSLFHIQAERLRRVAVISGAAQPPVWYVMTSPATHADTVGYFTAQSFFGLDPSRVVFFEQIELPCLTPAGKLILESADRLATAPDGNGDIYGALKRTGALDHMAANGIRHVLQYSVDNLLVLPADPLFVGYCIVLAADVGCKTVEKTVPQEPVGLVCCRGGRPAVVEYSEISPAAAAERTGSGRLVYSAAHLCINYFAVPFLVRAASAELQKTMWHHVAKKTIPSRPSAGNPQGRAEAWKLEQYIFDMFPNAGKLVVLQVPRESEFAPVKNADGSKPTDTPTTARLLLSQLHRSFILRAGGRFADSNSDDKAICEISPLLTYAGEGLEELVKDKTFTLPLHLQ